MPPPFTVSTGAGFKFGKGWMGRRNQVDIQIDKFLRWLRGHARRTQSDDSIVLVGFSTYYAVYVHEDMQRKYHNGESKFLETPLRRFGKRMSQAVADAVAKGVSRRKALFREGQFLLAEAQKLVPIDTGALHNSGFVQEV